MVLTLLLLMGCSKETNIIREDYEKDNDKLIKVEIQDNKIEKIKIEDIKNNLNKNAILYFCMPSSNYCRNNIEVLIEVVNDLNVKTYYVDLTDIKDSNEYKEFINKYNRETILDGDILVYSYSKVIDYLSFDSSNKDYSKKISEEDRKVEYKRLYDGISKLIDSESCDHENTGC
jgi:hypothetical protein